MSSLSDSMRIPLSVSAFALPAPLQGSIEALSGFGRASQLGIEIHQRVQASRSREFPGYLSEVPVTHAFRRGDFTFEVRGRMDGFFPDTNRIEEIKTTFNSWELSKRLQAPSQHPYALQLLTYGYIFWKQQNVLPELSFHLVSTRNFEATSLLFPWDPSAYEEWLEKRLEILEREAEEAQMRAIRRKKARLRFPFPEPRKGQKELIAAIEAGMGEGRPLMIQAPTGLGKTIGVLYPVLKEALSRGQRVIYVTPKNSQHSVAEEAVSRLEEQGAKVRSLTLTAKSKICFKNEPVCNPDACEFAKDHYTKLGEGRVLEKLAGKKRLSKRIFEKVAREHEVCPFEIQLDAAVDADVVICDYNYVFSPRSSFAASGMGLGQEGKPNLVIDEAHNLPGRAMDYYSPSVSTQWLERLREDFKLLPLRYRQEALDLLQSCLAIVEECRPQGCTQPIRMDPPAEPFLSQDGELKAFLSRYLEGEQDVLAGDPVLRLCFSWSSFTEALEFVSASKGLREEFFTTFHPFGGGGVLKITCCDASKLLEDAYEGYEKVVAFSATLKPFAYYAKLSGLAGREPLYSEFASPFPEKNRKVILVPQVSTKYSDRERSYPKVAEILRRVVAERKGNYLAFFPSFDFLERVLERFELPSGWEVRRQERVMKSSAIEEVLLELKEGKKPILLFAVQGGVFSEGVDYPGQMAIGAFIVGPPLPSFDLEREGMRSYYQKHFGEGFDYAYTYPAMAKAVQAAGRVIRSEQDRGLIVLLDNRFLLPSYSRSLPQSWFRESPRELVSAKILEDISRFWADEPVPLEAPGSACSGPAFPSA